MTATTLHFTQEQAEAIHARAELMAIHAPSLPGVPYRLNGSPHNAVRRAAAALCDHFDGWGDFETADAELDEALDAVRADYADLLRELAA